MHPYLIFTRVASLALAAFICYWLAGRYGSTAGILVWASVVTLGCAGIAILLAKQKGERITIVNRLAGFALPWGYRVGRGRLPAIATISAALWIATGAFAVFALGGSDPAAPATPTTQAPSFARTLLAIAWLVDGLVLLRFAQVWFTRQSPIQKGGLRFVLGLSLLVTISVVLFSISTNSAGIWLALAIAGGPPFFVGGGYLLFLLVVLLFGRNMRWN